jgi:hypothetical protein
MAADGLGRSVGFIGRYTAALMLLAVVGCTPMYGGPTGYTKADPSWGGPYGYSDKNIGSDEFAIIVTGNPKTSKERVADIALLRAARLADEQKRTHFVILNRSTQQLEGYATVNLFVGAPLIFLPVGETPKQEPHAVLVVRLLPNDQPRSDDALKTADVIAELSPRVD